MEKGRERQKDKVRGTKGKGLIVQGTGYENDRSLRERCREVCVCVCVRVCTCMCVLWVELCPPPKKRYVKSSPPIPVNVTFLEVESLQI